MTKKFLVPGSEENYKKNFDVRGPSDYDHYEEEGDSRNLLDSDAMPAKYHNYKELTEELHKLHKRWPEMTSLYKLSETSVEDRSLWVLRISKDIHGKHSDDLKPMVKYVGNIHGNEAVGKELLIHFAKYLLQSYSSPSSNADSEDIKKLIDTTDIHILPSMNPDGFEHSMTKDCSGVTGF